MNTEAKDRANPPPSGLTIFGGKETLMDQIIRFAWDESGAPAVEYALLLMFIAVAIAASVTALGNAVRGLFQGALDQWSGAS
jgi:Flp pilus assembly pilin Flp